MVKISRINGKKKLLANPRFFILYGIDFPTDDHESPDVKDLVISPKILVKYTNPKPVNNNLWDAFEECRTKTVYEHLASVFGQSLEDVKEDFKVLYVNNEGTVYFAPYEVVDYIKSETGNLDKSSIDNLIKKEYLKAHRINGMAVVLKKDQSESFKQAVSLYMGDINFDYDIEVIVSSLPPQIKQKFIETFYPELVDNGDFDNLVSKDAMEIPVSNLPQESREKFMNSYYSDFVENHHNDPDSNEYF